MDLPLVGAGLSVLGDRGALLSLSWASRTMLDFSAHQPLHLPRSSSTPRLHTLLRL